MRFADRSNGVCPVPADASGGDEWRENGCATSAPVEVRRHQAGQRHSAVFQMGYKMT